MHMKCQPWELHQHTQNARKHCLQNTLPSAKNTAKPNLVVCYINLSQPTCSAVSSGDAGYPDFQWNCFWYSDTFFEGLGADMPVLYLNA